MAKDRKDKQKKKGRSTQELIGVKTFSKYGIITGRSELLYYLVSPTNISVLSRANIEIKIVESMEQRKIMQNATRKNKLMSGGNDVNETIEAEGNLQDVVELLANLRKNKGEYRKRAYLLCNF